ncbi:MAG: hypothetical protein KDI82_07295 [Gammaproteobacteria bacterium]|nr:hypothetical protein [Gammaproteobacteria bacterium]
MKPRNSIVLITAGLLLAAIGAVSNAAQIDTTDACCLAAEWFAPATGVSAQSSASYCCIASEWSANEAVPLQERAESAVQADGETCCIAREWNPS